MVRDFAVWFALALVYTVLKYTETGEGEDTVVMGATFLGVSCAALQSCDERADGGNGPCAMSWRRAEVQVHEQGH
jgi:hypothetical protein